jgi:hypothetical protein
MITVHFVDAAAAEVPCLARRPIAFACWSKHNMRGASVQIGERISSERMMELNKGIELTCNCADYFLFVFPSISDGTHLYVCRGLLEMD